MQIEAPNLVRIEQLLPLQKGSIFTPIAYRQCSNLKIRALLILLTFRLIFYKIQKSRPNSTPKNHDLENSKTHTHSHTLSVASLAGFP